MRVYRNRKVFHFSTLTVWKLRKFSHTFLTKISWQHFTKKVDFTNYFLVRVNIRNFHTARAQCKLCKYSHTFLARISSKQRFYRINFWIGNWFHEIFFGETVVCQRVEIARNLSHLLIFREIVCSKKKKTSSLPRIFLHMQLICISIYENNLVITRRKAGLRPAFCLLLSLPPITASYWCWGLPGRSTR